jgi:hypothetical protein
MSNNINKGAGETFVPRQLKGISSRQEIPQSSLADLTASLQT